MKKTALVIMLIVLGYTVILAQGEKKVKDPTGLWKFESVYAPEGYTDGTLNVSYSDNKYSATMSFTGNGYKFSGENVKFEKDTLTFNFSPEGQNVSIKLAMESVNKLSGKGVYSEGEIPLVLVRVERK